MAKKFGWNKDVALQAHPHEALSMFAESVEPKPPVDNPAAESAAPSNSGEQISYEDLVKQQADALDKGDYNTAGKIQKIIEQHPDAGKFLSTEDLNKIVAKEKPPLSPEFASYAELLKQQAEALSAGYYEESDKIRQKIEKHPKDMNLTPEELDQLVEAGLIPEDQKWLYGEDQPLENQDNTPKAELSPELLSYAELIKEMENIHPSQIHEIAKQIKEHPKSGKLTDEELDQLVKAGVITEDKKLFFKNAFNNEQRGRVQEISHAPSENEWGTEELTRQLEQIRKELNGYNRKWKVDPSDIADFYILESLIYRPEEYYPSDTENLALLRARSRIKEIGKKVSFAVLRASLNEQSSYGTYNDRITRPDYYDNYARNLDSKMMSRLVPKYLDSSIQQLESILSKGEGNPQAFNRTNRMTREEVEQCLQQYREYRSEITTRPNIKNIDFKPGIAVNAVRHHLRKQKELCDAVDKGGTSAEDIFKDKQALLDTLNILAIDQKYKQWQTTAGYLKAYLFPGEQTGLVPQNMDPARRDIFLIDRLINQSHATGQLSEYISNDFPEMAYVLTLHGMSGNPLDALWQHASGAVRSDLTTRSKVLLGDRQPPSSDYQLTDRERESLRQKMTKYSKEGQQFYILGIALASKDKQVQQTALSTLSPEISIQEIRGGVQNLKHRLDLSIQPLAVEDPAIKRKLLFPLPD